MFKNYFNKRKLNSELKKANKERVAIMALFLEGSWKKTDPTAQKMFKDVTKKIADLKALLKAY